MCLRMVSLGSFLKPLSFKSSERPFKIPSIFSESLEYFPRSRTKRIMIKTNIGNITRAVTVYASTNESRFIFVQTRVVQVSAASNHLFRPLSSDFAALHFLRKFSQTQKLSKL